jgi:hypothetical protein
LTNKKLPSRRRFSSAVLDSKELDLETQRGFFSAHSMFDRSSVSRGGKNRDKFAGETNGFQKVLFIGVFILMYK